MNDDSFLFCFIIAILCFHCVMLISDLNIELLKKISKFKEEKIHHSYVAVAPSAIDDIELFIIVAMIEVAQQRQQIIHFVSKWKMNFFWNSETRKKKN